MNDFKSKINAVRDILRKDGITGMDSINHCVAFTILRNLNENICDMLNIPKKYTFENFNKDSEGKLLDKEKLFEKFYKKGNPDCFVGILINKLSFRAFKFLIKTSLYLESIFEVFKKINIQELSLDFDVIGIIYEIHLSTGAAGSAMRDLGQYFTNRKVIQFMVNLCNPKVKPNGEIETILDPSMGTGGFLTMATKYLNEHNENIDWELNKKNIYGFDISENMQSLSQINLLIENNKVFENVIVEDTLHNDYTINNVVIDMVDVILANEPFGLKNIIYKDCCERIKALKINGTKAEPLFVQLMMQSLKVGGRCAVIVPDGVLFNDAKLHKETRKYLINNLNLKKVIALDGDMFLNTGVKSSILFFVNDGTTTEVEFSKIKLVDSEILEESIKKVQKDKIIENEYSLFINKYTQVVQTAIDGVEYKKIKDICEILSNGIRNSSEGKEEGKYPLFYCSILGNLWMDTYDFEDEENIIINSTNGSGKCNVYYCKEKYSVAQSTIRFKSKYDNILTKYLFYYLSYNKKILENEFKGSNQKQLTRKDLNEIKIPIPSLDTQKQIVSILDNDFTIIDIFQKLINSYEIKKQKYIWMKTLNVKKKKLEDLFTFKCGKLTSKSITTNGIYNFYNGCANPNFKSNEYSFDSENQYILIIKDGGAGKEKYGENIGLGKSFLVEGKIGATTSLIACFIKNEINNVNIKYVKYYLDSIKNDIMDMAVYGVGLGHINQKKICDINIPLPSIELQNEIVAECENYDKMILESKKQIENIKKNNVIQTILNSIQPADADAENTIDA